MMPHPSQTHTGRGASVADLVREVQRAGYDPEAAVIYVVGCTGNYEIGPEFVAVRRDQHGVARCTLGDDEDHEAHDE